MIEGFIKRAFSHFGEPSSKRVIAGTAAFALCIGFLVMIEAISYQAHKAWDVSGAVVTVVLAVGGYVAWLAKQFFLKPDAPENVVVGAPPAPGSVVPDTDLSGGAK